jgi:hypothetical protein
MKLFTCIFLAIVLCLFQRTTAQSVTARYYIETIRTVFATVQEKNWDYTRTAAHGRSSHRIENKRKEMISAIQAGIITLKDLPQDSANARLRDTAISFLKLNYAVANEDYGRLVNMEKIAEQSYDAMEAYVHARDAANEKTRLAGESFNREFTAYANTIGVAVPVYDSRIEKNLETAAKVYQHYNRLYSVFFRNYKQEAYLLESMRRNDISGLEQNREALVRSSSSGLDSLSNMPPFAGDIDLKRSCEKVLRFYNQEADIKLRDISVFFVANDNLQKIILSYNNSAAAEHTLEESVLFNKALTEHKAAIEAYKKVSNELDRERGKVLREWHETCDKFIRRHIPKK